MKIVTRFKMRRVNEDGTSHAPGLQRSCDLTDLSGQMNLSKRKILQSADSGGMLGD
jgi:hypothetical protein